MRFLLTVGVLLVTAVLASAIYRPNPFKPTDLAKLEAKLLNLRRSTGNHFVQKRQSSACIDAYLETQSQRFQECSQLLGDGGNITTTELIEFCHHDDCVSLLIKVFTDLENCNAVDTNTTVSSYWLEFMRLSLSCPTHPRSGNRWGFVGDLSPKFVPRVGAFA